MNPKDLSVIRQRPDIFRLGVMTASNVVQHSFSLSMVFAKAAKDKCKAGLTKVPGLGGVVIGHVKVKNFKTAHGNGSINFVAS